MPYTYRVGSVINTIFFFWKGCYMILLFRIFLWIGILGMVNLQATQYVLSPTDDWFSILTGSSLQPGDEVVLTSGVYTTSSNIAIKHQGTADNPITIRAATGANVVFTHDIDHNVLNLEGARHLILQGLEVTGGSMGIRIYENSQGEDAKFITIQDCYIHHTGEAAITANHNNQTYEGMIFRRNEISHTGGTGEGLYLGSNYNQSQFFNSLIENNYIHHLNGSLVVQGDGVEIKEGSYNNIIRNNVIHDINYPGVIVYGTAGNGGRNTILGNVIWNCNDNALQAAADANVENNLIFNTLGDGIHVREHQNSVPGNLNITNNTVINNTGYYGIRITDDNISGDILLTNNTVYTADSNNAMLLAVSSQGGLYQLIASGNSILGMDQININLQYLFPTMLITGTDTNQVIMSALSSFTVPEPSTIFVVFFGFFAILFHCRYLKKF